MEKRNALLCVAFLALVWGTTFIATKIAIRTVPVFFMIASRELTAGLLMGVLARSIGKFRPMSWATLGRHALYGLGFFTGARGLMTLALDYAPAGLVALMFSLIPVYVLFINLIIGHAYFNRQIGWGLGLGATGMLLVFRESLSGLFDLNNLVGVGIAMLAAFCWAGTSIIVAARKDKLPPAQKSSVQLLSGSLGLFLLSLITGETAQLVDFTFDAVLSMCYLVIFGSLAAFLAFQYAIKHLPVGRATVYAYVNPFVALFFAWLILSEPLSPELVLFFGITMAGVFLVNKGYRKTAREIEERKMRAEPS